MHKQQGFSFWSLSATVIGIVFVAVIGMKLVPAYLEFFAVKKAIMNMKTNGSLKTMGKSDIQLAFSKSARIDNIKSVTPEDLEIGKDESGGATVYVEYQVQVPMVYNITALLDFSVSTDDRPAAAQAPAGQ